MSVDPQTGLAHRHGDHIAELGLAWPGDIKQIEVGPVIGNNQMLTSTVYLNRRC